MEYGLITGPWSGIPNLLLTAGFGLIVIIIGAILADRMGKKYAPFIMVGLMAGLQIMVSFTSSVNFGDRATSARTFSHSVTGY